MSCKIEIETALTPERARRASAAMLEVLAFYQRTARLRMAQGILTLEQADARLEPVSDAARLCDAVAAALRPNT